MLSLLKNFCAAFGACLLVLLVYSWSSRCDVHLGWPSCIGFAMLSWLYAASRPVEASTRPWTRAAAQRARARSPRRRVTASIARHDS